MSYYSETLKNQPIIDSKDYLIKDEDYKVLNSKIDKINKYQEKIIELESELAAEKERIILSKYTPAFDNILISYQRTSSYYNWNTGDEVESKNNLESFEVKTANSDFDIILGYDLSKGAIIKGSYKISINSNKRKMKKIFQGISVFEFKEAYKALYSCNCNDSKNIAKNFINHFFDCNYEGECNLRELSRYFDLNPNFEIIIKEAPKESVDYLLRNNIVERPTALAKALNLTKPTYNKLKEMDLLNSAIKVIVWNLTSKGTSWAPYVYIPENENEFIEILDICKQGEENLSFYNIVLDDRNKGLYYVISNAYMNGQFFKTNYTFKKFTNYVIDECINQGYKNIGCFISDLEDYLEMCNECNIKPSLYTSYLKQTHDIASRNYSIILEEKQEEILAERYKDFKDIKVDNYTVVVPRKSQDIKDEGNNLNHCVASYIKRIIDGQCLIFFLRKNKEESLITFEYRGGRVVQIRGAHNRQATASEKNAIEKWLGKIKEEK